MLQRILVVLCATLTLASCQFTETMVLQEDGSGRMSISVDMGEVMGMSGAMEGDANMVKQDTVISFKSLLQEKKDSIAKLPQSSQDKLKAIEEYQLHLISDPDQKQFIMDVYTDFKKVGEANDLFWGFGQSGNFIPGASNNSQEGSSDFEEPEIIGVSYTFTNGKFKRDAFIKDKEAHQVQLDSLKLTESFMSEIKYKLKYTFPRKIKSATLTEVLLSDDGRTLELEKSFLDYFKNPDILDLEIELEN